MFALVQARLQQRIYCALAARLLICSGVSGINKHLVKEYKEKEKARKAEIRSTQNHPCRYVTTALEAL